MKLNLVTTPKLASWIYPKRVWAFPNASDAVYLTFDDGPIPEVTPWVLQQLKEHQAKATFFCIGDNIRKHPTIFSDILSEGHSVGNHTYTHCNGWKTELSKYIEDASKCDTLLKSYNQQLSKGDTNLFRPPYGKLRSKQAKKLQKKGHTIIMWSLLSYDYDAEVSEEKCLQNVLKNIQAGNIVVFHDSLKAEKNLRYVLPKVLQYISEKGLKCEAI
ncbi:polysaccharide deacetylase family protein [Ulvibacter litoralis]|uniref:Peptidoglycan/xylan/chitin deacetylase, PgdA/CDA1 family n=1 Tax=Ulvibacter litoralis TaxID=227084 RepID=A0A1G7DRQ2_9FLAO|nr:polysaccharide deacetylase family protein [Ulvibacter litoralis]GHC42545.1 polysaccharide deacetylase [Ulvibacter litoralis]SDE54167.1 Peptidoglycan/xylan/chitin deacetylase, PgdA/CDA1 family [Ulvibacter litoralis]